LVCVSTLYDICTKTHFSERIPVVKRRIDCKYFLIPPIHKYTIAFLQQKAEKEGIMYMSRLNNSMLETQKLGLSGEILALILEVSVSILGLIRDWLILV
jgi:hypothetical protein